MSDLGLIETVKSGDLSAVKRLLESGADLNQQDEHGWTPLNWAAGAGNLQLVRQLVSNGADVFKVGNDQRTPYMIALAAGRADVARFLREIEDQNEGERPVRPARKYCKAYYLGSLRDFPAWTESRINWKSKKEASGQDHSADQTLSNTDVVFVHQDYTVTQSMWHDENVIFNEVTPAWKEFCTTTLGFRPPDDLDLIPPTDQT